ncbi:hypothetical protein COO60DRAFT_163883 [Scenedesmus sp. NREL 46B-D3]|nr:hypothetical protein COO60DRAFT_163883 [Scenedesmus sp. NREL 46B-D3]
MPRGTAIVTCTSESASRASHSAAPPMHMPAGVSCSAACMGAGLALQLLLCVLRTRGCTLAGGTKLRGCWLFRAARVSAAAAMQLSAGTHVPASCQSPRLPVSSSSESSGCWLANSPAAAAFMAGSSSSAAAAATAAGAGRCPRSPGCLAGTPSSLQRRL